jgi:hypothetical protein
VSHWLPHEFSVISHILPEHPSTGKILSSHTLGISARALSHIDQCCGHPHWPYQASGLKVPHYPQLSSPLSLLCSSLTPTLCPATFFVAPWPLHRLLCDSFITGFQEDLPLPKARALSLPQGAPPL